MTSGDAVVSGAVSYTHLVTVEGFILHFDGDLYGQTIRVEFYDYLRGERKFDTLEELRAEVMRNARQTEDFFTA